MGRSTGINIRTSLFLIFINELPEIFKQTNEVQNDDKEIIIYADDNTPTTSEKSPINLQTNIEKIGTEVTDWFLKNEMICSLEKTKLLIIGTKSNRKSKLEKDNMKIKIKVCGEEIRESNSENLLGLVINKNYALVATRFIEN